VTYRRLDCAAGTLAVSLASDATLFDAPQTITVRENGAVVRTITVPPTATSQASVVAKIQLHPVDRVCRLSFTASTLRVPARVEPGSTDTRGLAAHYLSFEYRP
jgi:hypothetical protein